MNPRSMIKDAATTLPKDQSTFATTARRADVTTRTKFVYQYTPSEAPETTKAPPATVKEDNPVNVTEAPVATVKTDEPVVQTDEPVVQTEGPVVQTEEPVVQTDEPVVQTEGP